MRALIAAGLMAGMALFGGAGIAQADDAVNREVCLAVMALYVNPSEPGGRSYALGMVERYPYMTYDQAKALVARAYASVQWHANPMCNGITIPDNY